MSEIGDLIAILGAVDSAVSDEDDGRRKQVADLVPAYRVGGRFGWHERFIERPDVEGLPTLEEAMSNLAEPTRFASMLPRRLLAIALVARMFGDRFGPTGNEADVSLRALIVPGIVNGLPPVPRPPPSEPPETPGLDDAILVDRARRLLAALADPAQLQRIEGWHAFLRSHADLISIQLTRLPAPCATTVVERPAAAGLGAIAVLQTSLCVGGVDLRTVATRFLDPARWPDCSPWWCGMYPAPAAGPGLRRFLEVVAADCANHLFEVAVFLDFATPVDWTASTVVTYNMSPDQSDVDGLHANDAVDVDRGAIEVRQERDHVHVTTTKRVRFTQPIDGAALAVIACWVGYGDVAADVICNCSGGQSMAVDCDVASPFTGALNRLVDLAHSCVTEAGDQARRVTDRLGSGTFSPETAVADATSMVALAMGAGGKLATAFVEAIGDLVRPPAQPSPLAASTAAPLRSWPFSFDPALPIGCSLSLAAPLRSPYGDRIETSRVVIGPDTLGPGGRQFGLAVDVAGLEGSAYTGEVMATSLEAGHEAGRARVYVIVP